MITVFDSCVWIDAKVFGGAAEAAITRALTLGVIAGCDQLWQEVNWVLTRKYQWPPRIAMDDIMFYAMYSIHIPIDGSIRRSIDPDDDFVLECAARAKAHAIVSSDLKHLVGLGSFECIPILTPEQYLIAPFAVDEAEIKREEDRTYGRALRAEIVGGFAGGTGGRGELDEADPLKGVL